ncbi:MAG: HD-GYP domain-containing protein [Candidatus Scalindua sp. AMX11]|nr:MAG: HD-GYP domain-containing protein [Candidatus Scalindua sp.]NOG83098.1 HD-GYP domain-containing protein [Planctomycetota bacterium]RZV75882.1 MAG: HD-GYP domain-containing protein [Candidatus Scalindua sp. SCAELEC01]TDE64940.1 MAG: HD-GYP domain-containing protein [Candidatus Scalindua sp. AMX11]GJQ60211.1 MAG: metal-dependent phosphohydrolase [Candidatus Scalindua sp.]
MNFYQIPTEDLKANTILNFNIYLKQQNGFVLFREKSLSFSEEILYRLIENRIKIIFVSNEDLEEVKKYYSSLEEGRPSVMTNDGFAGPVFDKSENVEKYYKTFFAHYPIERETLIPGSSVNFNVYKKYDIELEHYIGPDTYEIPGGTVPDDVRETTHPLAILKGDIPLYKEYLQQVTQEMSHQGSISQELRFSLLRENAKLIAKEILEYPRESENIEKSHAIVEKLVESVINNVNSFYHLTNIISKDYYTYIHSLNVCTLSIGLGASLNQISEPGLIELGLGAMLHDIGKSLINPRIINKPGRLTKDEFDVVQRHVVEGKKLLGDITTQMPENVFKVILQHHEKLTGGGYPYRLRGDDIHLFGRIVAIVDLYDAITIERPYRKANSPFEVLQLMSNSNGEYDNELLKQFVLLLGSQV